MPLNNVMLAKVYSAFPYGLEAKLVEIEVDVEPGLRAFHIIGLPDEAVKEATKRVSTALRRSGFQSPHQMNKKVTVNLAPADIKKQGSFFDVAIAVGFLFASRQLTPHLPKALYMGELSLGGVVRPVPGVLVITRFAVQKGYEPLFLPRLSISEAMIVPNANPIPLRNLSELAATLTSQIKGSPIEKPSIIFAPPPCEYDLGDIKGQSVAKRALEIAAAGGHHLFMIGPPGAGKSILAKAFPSLLPLLDEKEGLEVATILSLFEPLVSVPGKKGIILSRPFRAPHHSASTQALLGGGAPVRPGEITLAHRGVLFLDEFPEFHRDVLEGLRQPLEDKIVKISRSNERFVFPAHFQLIGAANPCPCGFKDEPIRLCSCTPGSLNRYERKFSGPLMDRLDLFIQVPRLSKHEMLQEGMGGEASAKVRKRVIRARRIQKKRFLLAKTNSEMRIQEIKTLCPLDSATKALLGNAIDRFGLSMRAYHKIVKVARTIADLEESEAIKSKHVAEALQYRKVI